MSYLTRTLICLLGKRSSQSLASNCNRVRKFCDVTPKVTLEKSVNKVILIGRVGIDPQLRGSESKPCVIFTLATNTNYRYESGELQQKTDWHRVSVFKPFLRDIVLDNLKKGSRVFIDGRILYGEFSDSKGNVHNTTTIVANDVIFLGGKRNEEEITDESFAEAT